MSAVSVICESPEVQKIADAASEYFSLQGGAEVEVVFCSEEEIRTLNYDNRGIDAVTDVLSFPALSLSYGKYKPFNAQNYPIDINPDSGKVFLGSIAVCREVAKRQAEEYGHSYQRETGYLFLHGLLHLLGFDHIDESDKAAMRKAEEEILENVGLSRENR